MRATRSSHYGLGRPYHECDRLHDQDELLQVVPGDSIWAKVQRWIRRRFLISASNKRSIKYLRSESAISFERRRQIDQYNWMIHPFSDFRVSFEIFFIVLYMSALYYQPFETVYTLESTTHLSTGNTMMLVCDVISMLGIVVNFRTGYLDKRTREVYLSSRYAAKHYAFSFFIFDLLAAVPYHVIPKILGDDVGNIGNVMHLVEFIKILRLVPVIHFYSHTSEVFDVSYFKYQVIRIIAIGYLFLHWTAAIHFLIPKIFQTLECDNIDQNSWIKRYCSTQSQILEDRNFVFYIESLFRASSNVFQVGIGQLMTPITVEDMTVTTVVLLCGRVLTFYALGRMLFLMKTLDSTTLRYYSEIIELEHYMQRKSFTREIRDRLLTYYEYRLQKTYYHEEVIFHTINTRLREDIMLHSCQKLVENVSFFQHFPITLTLQIVVHLRRELYLPNDTIIRAGDKGHSMFFIKFGTVAIYKASGLEVCHLEDGAHFGEIALVLEDDRNVASVVAVENCTLYRLDKRDFERVISPYPDLLARIVHVANERVERSDGLHEMMAHARVRNRYRPSFSY